MYVLIQLVKGHLPWQYIKSKNPDDYSEIMQMKAALSPQQLCKDLPQEFSRILEYILSLDSSLDPDYTYIEVLFKKCA